MSSLANSIRELRHAYGHSQQAFANMLGLSIASIAHYEIGNRSPDCRVTIKLLHAARTKHRKDLIQVFKHYLLSNLSVEEIASLRDIAI